MKYDCPVCGHLGQDHWMLITKYKELGRIIDAFLLEHTSSDSASQLHLPRNSRPARRDP